MRNKCTLVLMFLCLSYSGLKAQSIVGFSKYDQSYRITTSIHDLIYYEDFNRLMPLKSKVKSVSYSGFSNGTLKLNEKGQVLEKTTKDSQSEFIEKWKYNDEGNIVEYSRKSEVMSRKSTSKWIFQYKNEDKICLAIRYKNEQIQDSMRYRLNAQNRIIFTGTWVNYVRYDSRNRVVKSSYGTYKYDINNKLVSIVNGADREERLYLSDGKLKLIKFFKDNKLDKSFAFRYSSKTPDFQITVTRHYPNKAKNLIKTYRIKVVNDANGNWTKIDVTGDTLPVSFSRTISYY